MDQEERLYRSQAAEPRQDTARLSNNPVHWQAHHHTMTATGKQPAGLPPEAGLP
jgi:hypothetical protein